MSRLCLMFDKRMEEHSAPPSVTYTSHNGITIIPHPECPERISRIWKLLEESGVTRNEMVERVENGRFLTKDEFMLVHSEEYWNALKKSEDLEQDERDELAKEINQNITCF